MAVHYTRTRTSRALISNCSGCSLYHPHWLFIIPARPDADPDCSLPTRTSTLISNSGGRYTTARPQYRFLILRAVHYTTCTSTVPISNSGGLFIIPPPHPQYRFLILVAVHYTTRTSAYRFPNSGGCSLYHPRPQYRFLILVAVHYTARTSTVPISNSGGCSLYHPQYRPQYRFLILSPQYRFYSGGCSLYHPPSTWLFIIPPAASTVPISNSGGCSLPATAHPQYRFLFWWLFTTARPQYRFLILVAVHYTTRTSTVPISNSEWLFIAPPHVRIPISKFWWLFIIPYRPSVHSTDLILVAVHYTTATSTVPISLLVAVVRYTTRTSILWLFIIPPAPSDFNSVPISTILVVAVHYTTHILSTSTVPISNSGGCSLYHRTSTVPISNSGGWLFIIPPARSPQWLFVTRFLILVAVHYTTRTSAVPIPNSEWLFIIPPHVHVSWWLFIAPAVHSADFLILVAVSLYPPCTSAVPISNSGGCSLYHPHVLMPIFNFWWLFIIPPRTSTVPISNSGGCSLYHRTSARPQYPPRIF
ncbi:unnamed protein product [Acanthosepion pharaonis]|uniref:Uncharacterized protein n=1 Tax=Acanthosepion pharaonis TaxID=158019 RepID=A0A812EPL3_ACAPH|nr:unnamed protein product [Sepia pharaonis]